MAGIPLSEMSRVIVYRPPAHIKPGSILVMKRPSFEKGEFPEHLRPYAGQIRECPVMCKGRKGQAYRECLIKCAAKVRKR